MSGATPGGPVADFCAQLKKLHAGSGLTQRTLARRLHVSETQLSAILNGKIARPPSWDMVEQMVIACQCRESADGVPRAERARLLALWRTRHADLEDAFQRRRQQRSARPRASDSDALATVPAVPQVRYSLPADTAAFTGRSEELRQITAAAASASFAGAVVTVGAIDGMPGIGKTALALHAAHMLTAEFPDRQLFIDLHAHTPGREPVSPEDALAGLLAAVGVDPRYLPSDLGGRAAMWRDRMAGQRALLVLDNAASSSQVVPLLPGGGRCLVLVTSRRHLGDLPGVVTPVLADALPPGEAADMFIRLAPRAAADRDGVAEVVAMAGFLPLAISLLARVFARHPSWVLPDLVAETRAGVLALVAENDSVAAAFEVSYRHLHSESKRLFRLLGVHPGATIDRYAAAALAEIRPEEAARLLDGLHREGILTEAGYRRYGLHDLLRRYARDLAFTDAPADSQQALDRVLDFYQGTAALAGDRLSRQTRPGPRPMGPVGFDIPALEEAGQALTWARGDRANVLNCLDMAMRTGQYARIVAITASLAPMLRRDGPWTEAVSRHAIAVDAARSVVDRRGEANALADLGEARHLTGDYPGAAGVLRQALDIYRDLGDRLGEANALYHLGIVRRLTGDYPAAAGTLEEARGIHRDIGDQPGEAHALNALGMVRQLSGDCPGAAVVLEQALGICREIKDLRSEAQALTYLGAVRRLMGDYPAAGVVTEQALSICRDIGDRLGEANALIYLGIVRQVTGDYPSAAAILEQALAVYRDIGSRLGEANALTFLGAVRRLSNDFPGAVVVLERALSICRGIGDRLGEANALHCLGAVRRLTDDYPGAAAALAQALRIYRDIGHREGEAEVLNELGTYHRVRGDFAQAQECHQRALNLARAVGSSRDEAGALAGLGRCANATGNSTDAEVLLGQAHHIFQRIGAAETGEILAELKALIRSPLRFR